MSNSLRWYQDSLAAAERRWQRDIVLTIERCAQVCEKVWREGDPIKSPCAGELMRAIRKLR